MRTRMPFHFNALILVLLAIVVSGGRVGPSQAQPTPTSAANY